jgi:hypothetical protein
VGKGKFLPARRARLIFFRDRVALAAFACGRRSAAYIQTESTTTFRKIMPSIKLIAPLPGPKSRELLVRRDRHVPRGTTSTIGTGLAVLEAAFEAAGKE